MHISESVQLGKDSAYAQEIRKHEANYTQYGPPGRPYVFREYPTMMYRATRPRAGGVDPDFEGREAADDRDREMLERQGFAHGGKGAALAKLEATEFEIAELAANRALNDRRLSEQARAEADAVDKAAGIQHVAAVPEAHRKTGRRE